MVSVPLSFECETHASPDEPLLGISIDVSPVALRDLIASIGDRLPLEGAVSSGPAPRGVEPVKLDVKMLDASVRLLQCLQDPLESKALGPSIVGEILFPRPSRPPRKGPSHADAAAHTVCASGKSLGIDPRRLP